MKNLFKAAALVLLGAMGGACLLSAQTADIGQLRLTAPNFGYQTIGLYNFTGATQGCEQTGAQYNVCNAININSWQLTVTFAANASGLAPSPLVFTSSGAGDIVGPTDSSFDAYTGEAAKPWTLSFDLTNANCSPSCDAQISSIVFTGTIDNTTLQLYNGSVSGPYTLDSLPTQNFSVTWTIPATDYTATPGSLFDSKDIVISNTTPLTPQTITFGPLTTQTLGTPAPALTATATSTLAVTYASNATSVCTVSGTAVTLLTAGTCSITASQPGNATYAAATPVTQTFAVNQTPQTITFGPLTTQTLGTAAPDLTATATSNLAVTYLSNSTTVCTVSGTAVTLLTAGTCSITASQVGNATYAAATPVTQTFTVNGEPQTISFGALSDQILGSTPPALSATATPSGLTVAFASNNTAVCTVSGTAVTLVTVGVCSITASQPGNSIFVAATSITQTFNVTLTPQTISFGALSNQVLGSTPPALSATASPSGLTVAFASNSTAVCTVSGTAVTLVTAGTCSITASQAGNATYSAATPVTQTFTVLATQTISFGPLSNQALGSTPSALTAIATPSGLTVAFSSNTTLVCTVSSTALTLVTAGTCSITASQAGNATYAAATPVTQTFTVLALQTITFNTLSNVSYGTTPLTIGATATSTLPVTFASTTQTVCTISGNTVTILAAGACSLTASQPGDGTYGAATPVIQGFTVTQASQTITFDAIPQQIFGGSPFPIAAKSSSGLAIGIASTTPKVCIAASDLLMLLSPGTCSITASQNGNANESAATPVTRNFTVSQANPSGTLTAAAGSPFAAGANPQSVAVGDFNGDGIPDVASANVAGNNVTVLLGNVSGGFTPAAGSPFTVGSYPISVVVGDFNGDGFQDLATANAVDNTVTVLLGNGKSGFAAAPGSPFAVGSNPQSIAVGDLNGDGIQDLVTANRIGSNVTVLLGNGAGGFTADTGSPFAAGKNPQSVTVGDFNGDSIQDLAVSNLADATVTVLLGTGSGGFTAATGSPFAVGTNPQSVAVGDFNGDGNQDLAVANAAGASVTLLLGNGKGGFTASTGNPFAVGAGPFSIAAGDFNGDGLQDLVTANYTDSTVTILLGNGQGGFAATTLSTGSGPFFVAAADFNGDGIQDVVTANNLGGNVTVLLGGPAATNSVLSTTSPSTTSLGQTVPLTLTISDTGTSFSAPTGTVTFSDGTTVLGTATQNASPYTFTATGLTIGSHSFTASYSGDSRTSTSASNTIAVQVTLDSQTISFGSLPTQTLGVTTPAALTATATSGLVVTFASNSTNVCTVSNTTITLVAVGTCSITASQAGDATYAAATPVMQTFIVSTLTAQSITFAAPAAQTLGTAAPPLSATATSSLPVAFASNSSAVCTVSGVNLTLVSAGTCSITASQAGDGTYAAATPITQTFAVNKTAQTITFGSLTTQTLGTAPPALSATASSPLAVTFTSNSPAVCTVSGTAITLVTAGTCSISANQAGNATYAAATAVIQTFIVNLTPQTINFGILNTQMLSSTPPALNATATSGLIVTFASNSTNVCTVSGTAITLVAVGTCQIVASQAGNTTYAAATSVSQSFLVTTLTAQSITFGALSTQAFGSTPPALSATASSTLAVTFATNSSSVCTVSGTAITLVSVGTCSITASQGGNGTFATATPVTQTFTVTQGANTITFSAIGAVTLPASAFSLSATSSSGLTVAFASTTTSFCTVSGVTVTPLAAGTCSITASQAGNANYVAATPVVQSFTINPASTGGGGGSTGGGGGSTGGGNPLSTTPTSVTINDSLNGPAGTQTVTLSYVTQTQGAPMYSSNFNTNQGQGWLSLSPASGTMTQASFAGFVYTYTATVTIKADPTGIAAGAYAGTVNFSAGSGIISVGVMMNVAAQAPKFAVAPQSLSFNYQQGSTILPATQSLAVFSTPSGGSFTASASSTGNWLSLGANASSVLTTPSTVAILVNVANLSPGIYNGTVTIASGASVSIAVPVTLTIVKANPPVLSVAPTLDNLSFPQGSGASGGLVTVSNTGGGTLQFNSVATSDQGWLKINGSSSGSATPGSPASLAFTVTPGNLKPGLYNGAIQVSDVNSAAQSTVKVVLTITNPASQIRLSSTGLTLIAVAGGAAPQPQTFTVGNAAPGTLNWAAQTSTTSGGSWLTATPNSGTSTGGQTGATVSVGANITGLAAGHYYGSVNILGPNAVNSPQTVSVVLNVLPALPAASVSVSTGAVLLVGALGHATPVQQNVGLFNLSPSTVTYTSSTFTLNGTSWLSVTPPSGSLNSGANTIQIAADLSTLSPGLQSGQVTLGFGDGSTATIQVYVLVFSSGGSVRAGDGIAANALVAAASSLRPLTTTVAACPGGKASFLIPIFQSPAGQASVQVAAATTVQAEVIDDCGNPVTAAGGGAVQVTFGNGDPGINLTDVGSGIWTGTWTPQNAATQATLQLAATENGLTANPSLSTGAVTVVVQAATASSAPQPTGIANAASAGQATPQVVSPGSYIAIYGTGLAGSGNPNAPTLPLPTQLNGTQLFLGGIPMPLLYAASGQVNALVPLGIAPNATYPLVVVQGNAQSVPVPLTVTELQAGQYTVDTSGSGAGIVTNLAGALNTPSNPAHAGDFLIVYGTGLGALKGANGEAQPGDGAAAPSTLIYYTTSQVTATIGGVNAPVTFSGLTAGFALLYQINVQMPKGVTPGSAVPLVLTATDPTTGAVSVSNSVTIAVQ